MSEREGIYTSSSEGSFRSVDDIRRETHRRSTDLVFPDKKQRVVDFDRVTDYIQEGRDIIHDFEIGQREAIYIPEVEYPDLPLFMSLASDLHYGSFGVNYPQLRRHLDIVERVPNFSLATNGDEVDAFNAVFHPVAMQENPIPPQLQSRALVAGKLQELDRRGKIGVISQGNHNRGGYAGGQDWYDSFLSDFRCPVFTSGGLLKVYFNGIEYRILINHTYWGKSRLNITNAAKRMMEYEGGGDVDVAWLGHTHQSSYEHFERGGKDVLAVVSGTYKVDDKWAAQNGIGGRGQQPGITLMLYPHERRIEAFKNIESAVDYLRGKI